MNIGLPLWYNTVLNNDRTFLKELLGKVRSYTNNVVNYFEISIDYPWPYKKKEVLLSIIEESLEQGFKLGLHAPWRDLHYASPYQELHNAYLKILTNAINLVKEYSIDYVVLHVTTHQKIQINDNRKESIQAARKFLDKISRLYGDYTQVLVENMPLGFTSSPQDLRDILEGLNVKIALDIAHIVSAYYRYFTSAYENYIEFLKDFITVLDDLGFPVVHVHDIVFTTSNKISRIIEHVIPGKGVIDWRATLKQLKRIRAEYVLIESFVDSKGNNLDIVSIASQLGDFLTWLRIYL